MKNISEQKPVGNDLIKQIIDSIGALDNIEGINNFEEFAVLFALEDKQFDILKEVILSELEKSLNNSSDKYLLLKSLEQNNVSAEQFIQLYNKLLEEIDKELSILSETKRDFLKRIMGIVVNAINETEGTSNEKIYIPIELCHPEAKIPSYANIGDAGLDVFALEDITVNPGETKLVKTGLKVAIPKGYELQVRPKSGRALKTKLRVANSPGTVDPLYRQEVGVIIENIESPIQDITYDFDENQQIKITSILHGKPFNIGKGEKFAQLVLNKVPTAVFYEINDINNIEGDRGGGFGSSGLK